MCGSDLRSYRKANSDDWSGATNSGVVAARSGVRGGVARVGACVMVHHYHGCTTCEHCRSGWAQLCTNGETEIYGINRHGAHAPYMLVPADTLVPLDDRLPTPGDQLRHGTAWGAQADEACRRDTIAIFGQGPVGLGDAVGRCAGQGHCSGRRARTFSWSKAFGAAATINPRDGHVKEQIWALTHGKGADKSLETSGSSAAAKDALDAVKTWGVATLVGLGAEVAFDVRAFLGKQITILTSWSMSILDQEDCAEFIIDRETDIDSLFTDTYRLEQAETAYGNFDKQTSGKGVFLFP